MLNYENYQVPDQMVEDHDEITVESLREAAEAFDRVYAESVTSDEELEKLSRKCDSHIYETMRFFADFYEGKPLCIMLSGFLHLALTCIYTTSYELEQVKMRHDIEDLGVEL